MALPSLHGLSASDAPPPVILQDYDAAYIGGVNTNLPTSRPSSRRPGRKANAVIPFAGAVEPKQAKPPGLKRASAAHRVLTLEGDGQITISPKELHGRTQDVDKLTNHYARRVEPKQEAIPVGAPSTVGSHALAFYLKLGDGVELDESVVSKSNALFVVFAVQENNDKTTELVTFVESGQRDSVEAFAMVVDNLLPPEASANDPSNSGGGNAFVCRLFSTPTRPAPSITFCVHLRSSSSDSAAPPIRQWKSAPLLRAARTYNPELRTLDEDVNRAKDDESVKQFLQTVTTSQYARTMVHLLSQRASALAAEERAASQAARSTAASSTEPAIVAVHEGGVDAAAVQPSHAPATATAAAAASAAVDGLLALTSS